MYWLEWQYNRSRINGVFRKGRKWRITDLSFNIEELIEASDYDFFKIKCVTVFTACHLCFLLTLLITCLISDHVVTTCHFLLSKRFCLNMVSLWELSLITNSLFLFFNEYAWHLLLFNTYCLCHFIVFVILIILIVLCSRSCNSVRMSLNSIKGDLLTYLQCLKNTDAAL